MDQIKYENCMKSGEIADCIASCTEENSEIIEQATDNVGAKENLNVVPRLNSTEETRRITSSEPTQILRTNDVIEIMNHSEIFEPVMGENVDGISETMDIEVLPKAEEASNFVITNPEIEDNNMIDILEKPIMGTNVDGTNETMNNDVIPEADETGNFVITNPEIKDNNVIDILEEPLTRTNVDGISETMDIEVLPEAEEAGSFVITNPKIKDNNMIDRLEKPIMGTNVDGMNETMDIEAVPEADEAGIFVITNPEIEDNSVIEEPNIDGTVRIMRTDQSTDSGMLENLKNMFGPCSECTKIPKTTTSATNKEEEYGEVTNQSNVDESVVEISMDSSNVSVTEEVNEITEQERASKTMIMETTKLRIASGRKRKLKVPPVSEMVLDSVKSLKSNRGVSFEEIKDFMEENYPVTVKALIKYHVNNFLQKCVHDGTLEEVDGADTVRFKFGESVKRSIAEK